MEEDTAREEMDTLAVEGKVQLPASNCPGMGLWRMGSMWEALMEGTEVMTSISLIFAGSGEPGNAAGSGSGLNIGEIALSNWVLSPGKVGKAWI